VTRSEVYFVVCGDCRGDGVDDLFYGGEHEESISIPSLLLLRLTYFEPIWSIVHTLNFVNTLLV
jgi:hypothetical protein